MPVACRRSIFHRNRFHESFLHLILSTRLIITHSQEMRLEHIGIAVKDAKTSADLLKSLLGLDVYKVEDVASEAVSTMFLSDGNVKLELVEPTSDHAALGRYLEKYGEGLHHLAFEVDDIERVLVRLRDSGFRVLSDHPYAGADGKSVFFVHPLDTNHILFEFCQSSRPVLKPVSFKIGNEIVEFPAAGHPDNPVVLMTGVDAMDPIVASLEPDFRLISVPPNIPLTPALAETLADGNGFSLLCEAPSADRLDDLQALDPGSTVVLTTNFDLPPALLPTGNILVLADSGSTNAGTTESMEALLEVDSLKVSIMDTGGSRRARKLVADSIYLFLTSTVRLTMSSGQ